VDAVHQSFFAQVVRLNQNLAERQTELPCQIQSLMQPTFGENLRTHKQFADFDWFVAHEIPFLIHSRRICPGKCQLNRV
jgi:hypothetical protein